MSWIGVRQFGYSGADIARYLGVMNSCVTRMISSGKKSEIDDINNKAMGIGPKQLTDYAKQGKQGGG